MRNDKTMAAHRVGLLGWPVGHSISPAMHNAAFAALGLDWRYEALAVPPAELEAEVARLVNKEGYRGFNATIPHKEAVLRLPQIGEISRAACEIGAANTLTVLPDGTLRADNTDWLGFANDLRAFDITVGGVSCLVLGTGGSARAVTYALKQKGAADVMMVSRDPGGRSGVAGYGDLSRLAPGTNLVVNCTPLGMAPHTDHTPWPAEVPFPPGAILYDLIYNPPLTRLMMGARAAGAHVLGGLGMLVWQGALAFEEWTGSPPLVDIMFDAARTALNLMQTE
jgi:shikimate dehydrogenase